MASLAHKGCFLVLRLKDNEPTTFRIIRNVTWSPQSLTYMKAGRYKSEWDVKGGRCGIPVCSLKYFNNPRTSDALDALNDIPDKLKVAECIADRAGSEAVDLSEALQHYRRLASGDFAYLPQTTKAGKKEDKDSKDKDREIKRDRTNGRGIALAKKFPQWGKQEIASSFRPPVSTSKSRMSPSKCVMTRTGKGKDIPSVSREKASTNPPAPDKDCAPLEKPSDAFKQGGDGGGDESDEGGSTDKDCAPALSDEDDNDEKEESSSAEDDLDRIPRKKRRLEFSRKSAKYHSEMAAVQAQIGESEDKVAATVIALPQILNIQAEEQKRLLKKVFEVQLETNENLDKLHKKTAGISARLSRLENSGPKSTRISQLCTELGVPFDNHRSIVKASHNNSEKLQELITLLVPPKEPQWVHKVLSKLLSKGLARRSMYTGNGTLLVVGGGLN